jgi:hypothetical protein
MNKARNLVEMGDFYASSILTESLKKAKSKASKFPGKDTFPGPAKKVETDTVKTGKAFNDAGPERNNKSALKKPLEPNKKDSHYEVNKFSSQTYEKMEVQDINNSMNKSIFDRLYEDVMSENINTPEDLEHADAEALELPGSEAAGEEGEVTITLDRELAKKLHDVLMSVLGSEEEKTEEEGAPVEGEVSDEAAEDESDDESEEEVAAEATELKEVPSSAGTALQGKNNKVGDTTAKNVDGKHGDGNVNNKVDGSGTPIKDIRIGAGVKADTIAVKGKSNIVASKTSKVGSYLAGLK